MLMSKERCLVNKCVALELVLLLFSLPNMVFKYMDVTAEVRRRGVVASPGMCNICVQHVYINLYRLYVCGGSTIIVCCRHCCMF